MTYSNANSSMTDWPLDLMVPAIVYCRKQLSTTCGTTHAHTAYSKPEQGGCACVGRRPRGGHTPEPGLGRGALGGCVSGRCATMFPSGGLAVFQRAAWSNAVLAWPSPGGMCVCVCHTRVGPPGMPHAPPSPAPKTHDHTFTQLRTKPRPGQRLDAVPGRCPPPSLPTHRPTRPPTRSRTDHVVRPPPLPTLTHGCARISITAARGDDADVITPSPAAAP